MGDCWPHVTAHVTLVPPPDTQEGAPILLKEVNKVQDLDVTATNGQGIPVGNDLGRSTTLSRDASGSSRAFEAVFLGSPYPSWYYAFVDLNGNATLDPGEPFGVDVANPYSTGCRPRSVTVIIDRFYECSPYGPWHECWPSKETR
jgi:hypothetical protein